MQTLGPSFSLAQGQGVPRVAPQCSVSTTWEPGTSATARPPGDPLNLGLGAGALAFLKASMGF